MEAGSVSSTLSHETSGGCVSSKQESKPRKQVLNEKTGVPNRRERKGVLKMMMEDDSTLTAMQQRAT